MSTSSTQPQTGDGPLDTLYRDGIIACKGAFSTEWADRMREDIEVAFEEARSPPGRRGGPRAEPVLRRDPPRAAARLRRPGGPPVGARGLHVGPGAGLRDRRARLRHPLRGSDEPAVAPGLPRAGRDVRDHRLTSLAFNLTAVDTDEDMGPFEIALDCSVCCLAWARSACTCCN